MRSSVQQPDVQYICLFFPPECEEHALQLASIFSALPGNSSLLIQPGDLLEDLVGWGRRCPSEVMALLMWFEDRLKVPKEIFSELDTFRDLVNYLTDRDGVSDVHCKRDVSFRWTGLLG